MLWAVGCFACAAGGCLTVKDIYADWSTKVFGGWLSIIFFGGGGLFLILPTLFKIICVVTKGGLEALKGKGQGLILLWS